MDLSARERDIEALSRRLGEAAEAAGLRVAVAESCTGGWIAKVITDIPGSSRWFDRGFVTYSNEAKQELLGVSEDTLLAEGAVSEATAREMAAGALAHSRARLTAAVTGIAGPGGATPGKPVGMVCFAWAREGGWLHSETEYFIGDRNAVRLQAVGHALRGLLDAFDP